MFVLTVVTPTKKVFVDLPIDALTVTADRGELNILPGHAPLITTLGTGVLKYVRQGESSEQHMALSWGYCEVHPYGVNILAETAETPEEIDLERVHVAKQRAEEKLNAGELDWESIQAYYRKIARAQVREEVAKLKTN